MTILDELRDRRALAIVRADRIADPERLASTLVAAGLPMVEFSLTTGNAVDAIRAASTVDGCRIGAGTVLTADAARAVVAAGAGYLVTPSVNEEVAAAAAELDVPVLLGAFTPTEVYRAHQLGSPVVKVFPAQRLGPEYFRDLNGGPFPDIPLLASGGVTPANAADYLQAGAVAVTAGSSVVSRQLLAAGDYDAIAWRAEEFAARSAGR